MNYFWLLGAMAVLGRAHFFDSEKFLQLTPEVQERQVDDAQRLKQATNQYTLPLTIVVDYYYSVSVGVGTRTGLPQQTGDFLWVNDQSGILTPSTTCTTTCAPAAPFFDPTASTSWTQTGPYSQTSNMAFNATTGTDLVCLGGVSGLCLSAQEIMLVDEVSWTNTSFIPDEFQLNGMFGIGRPNATDLTSTNFLARAVQALNLSSTTWSFEPNANYSLTGTLLIGGYNSSGVVGNFSVEQSPATNGQKWITPVQNFLVDGQVYFDSAATAQAEFLTGYLYIGLDSTVWGKVCAALQSFYASSGNVMCDQSLPYASATCTNFLTPFNTTFRFGNDNEYVLLSWSMREETAGTCYWYYENVGPSTSILVGQPFLKQFYSVFDSDNEQVSFGISSLNSNYLADGPWIIGKPAQVPTPTVFDVALQLVDSYIFTLDTSFGTPPQNGTFLLATDQSAIMTPSTTCTTCGAAVSFYNSTASGSYVLLNVTDSIVTSDATYNFALATETVCLGGADAEWGYSWTGFCLNDTQIMVVDSITWSNTTLALNEFQVNGQFGLGRPNSADIASTNFIARATQQGYLNSTAYAFEPNANYSLSGSILGGGYNQNNVVGNVSWESSPFNSSQPDSWIVQVQNFTVNNIIYFDSVNTAQAEFLTGYQYIGLEQSVWANLCSALFQFYTSNGTVVCTQSLPYSASPCSNFAAPFNTMLRFGTYQEYTLASWTLQQEVAGSCYWLFENVGPTTSILVGQPFLKQFYSIFDSQNSAVGFGISTVNPNAPSEGPWISTYVPPPPPPPTPVPLPAIFNIAMALVDSYIFTLDTSFGTPPQNGTFLLATDQSAIMTPSTTCTTCGTAAPFYNSTASSSYVVLNAADSIVTSDATYNFTLATETVCLGGADAEWGYSWTGFCLNDTQIMVVDSITWSNTTLALNEFQVNGQFGLGRPNSADIASTNFIARATQQGYLNSTAYAFEPNADYSLSGSILVGGYNQNNVVGNVSWESSPFNSSQPDSWTVQIQNFTVLDQIFYNANLTAQTEFLTGYQYIGLDSTVWGNVCQALSQFYAGSGVIDCTNILPYSTAACSNFITPFNTTFRLGTLQEYTLASWTLQQEVAGSCYWLFENVGLTASIWIGQPFLKQFYSIFDSQNSAVGFSISTVNPNAPSEGPWISTYVPPPPPPTPVPLPAIFNIAMALVDSYIFTLDTSFGTPPQNGTFLLATDQSAIMTPSPTCSTCGAAVPFYNSTASSSYVVLNAADSIVTSDETYNFTLATETVCLGGADAEWGYSWTGFCLNDTQIMVVDSITWSNTTFALNEFQVNGQFGLGRPDSTDIASTNFIARAMQQGYLNSTAYAFEPNADYSLSGSILVGGYDVSSLQNNSISWIQTPLNPSLPDSWISIVQNFTVLDQIFFNSSLTTQAEFISGYQYLGLDSSVWGNVCAAISTNLQNAVTCNSTVSSLPFATGPCSTYNLAWNTTLRFSSFAEFTVSAATLAFDDTSSSNCFWSFEDIGASQSIQVGQPFLKQFYSVFDADISVVGFGVSTVNPAAASEGPWITTYVPPPIPVYALPLKAVESYVFVVNATLGDPPQLGTFLLSNDVSQILTPSLTCATCNPATAFFDPAQSSIWTSAGSQNVAGTPISLNATTGSTNVCLGYDGTTVNGFCMQDTLISLVDDYSVDFTSSFVVNEFQLNGAFGLGRPNGTDTLTTNFIARAYQAEIISTTTYAFEPSGTPGQAGVLLLGGYDETNFVNGTLIWTNSTNTTVPDSWYTDILDMILEGATYVHMPKTPIQAQFKTGYRYLGLASDSWLTLCNQLALYNFNQRIYCDNTMYSLPYSNSSHACNTFATNWNFTIQLSPDNATVLSGRTFLSTDTFDGTNYFCEWAIQNLGDTDYAILGQQFIDQFYTIFDSESNRIGLAIGSNSLGVAGPWITGPPGPDPTPEPPGPTPTPTPSGMSVMMIGVISGASLLVLGAIIAYICSLKKGKKKSKKDKTKSKIDKRDKRDMKVKYNRSIQ